MSAALYLRLALAAYLTLTLMIVVGLIRLVSHLLRRLHPRTQSYTPNEQG